MLIKPNTVTHLIAVSAQLEKLVRKNKAAAWDGLMLFKWLNAFFLKIKY